jgi:flagellar motor switch/type III secretory pathway protein FliN
MDAGAVIPLKMRKDDHVDVLFGGKVIGRGDVVSVKEKYGTKLTEVKL